MAFISCGHVEGIEKPRSLRSHVKKAAMLMVLTVGSPGSALRNFTETVQLLVLQLLYVDTHWHLLHLSYNNLKTMKRYNRSCLVRCVESCSTVLHHM